MGEYRGRHFRIHYVEQGDGAPVVFAHGYVMDHTMWAPQFEDLPDDYRCIAWDMRGHGFSAAPDGPWTMQDLTDDLMEFVSDVAGGPSHLVGHSIGGMIALAAALQRPELVRSLALVASTPEGEEPEKVAMYRGFVEAIEAQGVTDDLIAGTLPFFYADDFVERERDDVGVHTKRVKEMTVDALVETLQALIRRETLHERLAELRVPVLVVHGDADRAIDVSHARRAAEAIAGSELLVIAGCGHTPPLEAPDVLNDALARFLRRASG